MKLNLLSLSLLVLVSGCQPINEEDPKEKESVQYEYSITADHQIKWNNILSKSESRYMVYFYSEFCAYCKQVKQDILMYYSKNIDEMFFVDTVKEKAVYKNNDGLLIGTKNINDFYIFGTPFLVEITNYVVTNWYAGVDSIRLYIASRLDDKK